MKDSMDSLFPPVNEKATIKNCQRFLTRVFPRMYRVSGLSSGNYDELIAGLKSPSMDGMPKPPSRQNNADVIIVRRVYAQQVVRHTIQAISRCDNTSKDVLSQRYLDNYTDTMCYMAIGYSRSHYFDVIKPAALLQFADAYLLDDLHIYLTDTSDLKDAKNQQSD